MIDGQLLDGNEGGSGGHPHRAFAEAASAFTGFGMG
jgi:hypothetical protein